MNKPKYFLSNLGSSQYQIIYPDYINIKEIYQLIKSKYNIAVIDNDKNIDAIIHYSCNINPHKSYRNDINFIFDKLNNLDSNTFTEGGLTHNKVEDDSLCPTLSQTGNCVILSPAYMDKYVKIRDNAIVGCGNQYTGNMIIKDNTVVLNTTIWCSNPEVVYSSNYKGSGPIILRIQNDSVILNSKINFDTRPLLYTINIQDYTYLNNVRLCSYHSLYRKNTLISLSGYTHLENVSIWVSLSADLILYNTTIILDEPLSFFIDKPCNLTGVTITIKSKNELYLFFVNNNIEDKNIIKNNNVVRDAANRCVLLDDFLKYF
jgi:hypothetical protein